jgi:hypothetical protein
MKKILNFKLFESSSNLTDEQVQFLNETVDGTWKHNSLTRRIDIDGDFDCSFYLDLSDFKGISFGVVSGDFNCSHNKLESLKDCPEEVGGSFDCDYNKLISLKGAPLSVGVDFDCSYNKKLKSLDFAPTEIGGKVDCSHCGLSSLAGLPEALNGSLICSNNNLTDLSGAPKSVRSLMAKNNNLSSLKGCPSNIEKNLNVSQNELKNLNGLDPKTQIIRGDMDFSNNEISDISNIPIPREGVNLNDNGISTMILESLRPIFSTMKRYNLGFKAALLRSWEEGSGNKSRIIDNLFSLVDVSTAYSAITEHPKKFEIIDYIKKELPSVWRKIEDYDKEGADTSADLADLGF